MSSLSLEADRTTALVSPSADAATPAKAIASPANRELVRGRGDGEGRVKSPPPGAKRNTLAVSRAAIRVPTDFFSRPGGAVRVLRWLVDFVLYRHRAIAPTAPEPTWT